MAIWRIPIRITSAFIGGTGANVWHCRSDAGATEEASIEEAVNWVEAFYTAIATVYEGGAQILFDGVVTQVGVEDPTAIDTITPFTVVASGAGGPLPPANCIVVGWKTALATRSGRGRTFLGPLKTNTNEANGTPAAATLTTVRNAATALVASSMAETAPPSALGVWSPTDQVFRDFTGSAVRDKFAVLRSRRD